MYWIGFIALTIFNAFIYYDQAQHNKDDYKLSPYIFNLVIFCFYCVELLFFTLFYLITQEIIKIICTLN